MQCTKKGHLTDTALPSKSIPCSPAAQRRETSSAQSTMERYLQMRQSSATLGALFKKNKQQHRDIWETWHEVYKSKLNSPNEIATNNLDAVNTTYIYYIRWTQLRWIWALLSKKIKLVSCSLSCWRGWSV